MSPFYCKLFIDTEEIKESLSITTHDLASQIFGQMAVGVPVYRNENFDLLARERRPYDFIEFSRYYSEVEAEDKTEGRLSEFQSGVATLILRLREGGRFVTASCVFEELIAADTGWNWTEAQPEPPGRMPL